MQMKRRGPGTIVPFILYLIFAYGVAGAYIFAAAYLR